FHADFAIAAAVAVLEVRSGTVLGLDDVRIRRAQGTAEALAADVRRQRRGRRDADVAAHRFGTDAPAAGQAGLDPGAARHAVGLDAAGQFATGVDVDVA